MAEPRMILVPILLREEMRVEVRIPEDLTEKEAERICRVVMAYSAKDQPHDQ